MGFLGRLIPWDGFVNLMVIFENKACSGSIFGTKVYASAYEEGWLKWLKLSKNGLHPFLLVVSPRISPQSILKQVLEFVLINCDSP